MTTTPVHVWLVLDPFDEDPGDAVKYVTLERKRAEDWIAELGPDGTSLRIEEWEADL